MRCEICGKLATFHVQDLQEDGRSAERHYCRDHAIEAGLPASYETPSVAAAIPSLRSLVAFMRNNNRMPRPDEMAQFGAAGVLTATLPGTTDFDRQVAYLEDVATFIEQHDRLPTEQKLLDPF